MTRTSTLKKPILSTETVRAFAEGATRSQNGAAGGSAAGTLKSGLVPQGDVRLTSNIRVDLHMKLKIRAVQRRTTVGELIEEWIEGWED